MYFLMSPKGRSLLNPQAGGGTYNISSTDFQKVQISFPNLVSQQQIVSDLDSKMKFLADLLRMKSEAENRVNKQISEVWGIEFEELKEEVRL
jgi:restriction endonuclease S subunit